MQVMFGSQSASKYFFIFPITIVAVGVFYLHFKKFREKTEIVPPTLDEGHVTCFRSRMKYKSNVILDTLIS